MAEKKKILIAEDDDDILKLLTLYLESDGYTVLAAPDGEAAFEQIQNDAPDLGIFDIMMPKMDGYALLKKARAVTDMPVIFLSAKNSDQEKILGLDLGADDYIAKPFNPLEVTARVRAALRRTDGRGEKNAADADVLTAGNLTVDRTALVAKKDGQALALTATELKMLMLFMSHPGWVFTKKQIMEQMNEGYLDSDINAVRVHISNLREKLGPAPDGESYIKTVRGLGYKFTAGDGDA